MIRNIQGRSVLHFARGRERCRLEWRQTINLQKRVVVSQEEPTVIGCSGNACKLQQYQAGKE